MPAVIKMRICAKCHKHSKMWKAGTVWIGGRKVQKYQCLNCGFVSVKMKVA